MSNLPERVEQSICRRRLLRRGQSVLVAVSGGVDSMALLDLLQSLASKHGWHLTVAHLNHQLRGRSSDADARLVRRIAKKLFLPFIGGRADVRRRARTRKLSLEMAAREVRHEFLARTAARLKIQTVALAHHADDQLELFFLRLFRGSGSEGLAGMKWRNPSPADPKLELVRPLLDQPKRTLRDYMLARRICFREDATNASPDIQRNRIRHELLPLLRRQYQPALDRTLLRLMDILGAEAEFVSRMAVAWLSGRKGKPFGKLPVAVQRGCIQLQLLRREIQADYELVERLRSYPGRRVTVSPDTTVFLDERGRLRVLESKPPSKYAFRPSKGNQCLEAELQTKNGHGSITFGGLEFRWRVSAQRGAIPSKPRPGSEFFDADKVGSKVILRHWQPGDRFQPIGLSSPVKLQDLFTNQKIPREQRHKLVVVTTTEGELVWVEKLRISERFKLSDHTNRRLQWRWKQL